MASTTIDHHNDVGRPKEFRNSITHNNSELPHSDSFIDAPTLLDDLGADTAVLKTLIFRHPGFTCNWTVSEITESSRIPAYFITVSTLAIKKPAIVLHEGNDKSGPRLACSHVHFLPPFSFGLGDPEETPQDVVWNDLRSIARYSPFNMAKFEFDVDVPEKDEGMFSFEPGRLHGKKKTFVWVRTHAAVNGVTGLLGKISFRNYKLIDVESGRIVAVFLANCLDCFKCTGELRLYQEVPKVLEVAIVVTCATINEYLKRTRWPSSSLFPGKDNDIRTAKVLQTDDKLTVAAFTYGPDPGSEVVREEIAKWLTKFYKPASGPVTTASIFIGNGASASLGIILQKFTDPIYTRRVWMIEPTYFLACPIFEDAGFEGKLRGAPEDEEGIDIAYLKQQIEQVDHEFESGGQDVSRRIKSKEKYPKLYRHVIYVVPTYSNPSGKVMSMRRRRALVQLARDHDALIVADDVYDMLQWPTNPGTEISSDSNKGSKMPPPPPRIVDIDRQMDGRNEFGNSCSNGSFSKIVGPGVRCSWVDGTEKFAFVLSTHGATKSGGCPSQLVSIMMLSNVKEGGIEAHLKKVVLPTYQKRYWVMTDSIKKRLGPLGVTITGGLPVTWRPDDATSDQQNEAADIPQAGGFFCYIRFPDDLPPANEIADIAKSSYALMIGPGQRMLVAGDPGSIERCKATFGRGARLSWSWCTEDEIQEGIERLAMVLTDIREGKVKSQPNGDKVVMAEA